MEKAPTDAKDKPLIDIILERVTIHANPMALKEPPAPPAMMNAPLGALGSKAAR
jgi:hypothetical protein